MKLMGNGTESFYVFFKINLKSKKERGQNSELRRPVCPS